MHGLKLGLVEILVEEPKEISKIGQLKALKLNSECQLNRNRNFSRNRILNEKLNRFSQLIITKMKNVLLFVYFYETIGLVVYEIKRFASL